jgi:hypothetical protein
MAHSMALLGGAAPKPLQYIATGLGAGYGSAVTSIDGPSYIQSYATTYKLNKNGRVVWARQFSGTGNKQGLAVDSSQNVYVAGNSSFVASLDSSGNVRWQRTIGTGISWQSLDVDSSSNRVYLAGNNGSYGHIACLNSSDGSVIWGTRTSTVSVDFTAIKVKSGSSSYVTATGYTSNGVTLDSHFVVFDTSGNIIFQKRLSTGTANYVFSQSTSISPDSSELTVSGFIQSPRVNFIIGFNGSGTTIFSIRATSTGGYIQSDYGTIGYDASGFLYLSFYSIFDNYIPYDKGLGYTRFSGSTPQKTVIFENISGALRISASSTDRTIGLMGVSGFVKVLGDDSVATGPVGAYEIIEDPEGYGFTSSGITITTDSISYTASGVVSSASAYSVISSSASPTVTYLR